jgi:cytoskeletal protein RodZ
MLRLGELLKNKREEKGLVLSQVSESTKIPQKLLRALEEGRYDSFASDVYLKGFLKNYAKFLGLDTSMALAIYRRERRNKKDDGNWQVHRGISEPKPIITPGRLVVAITIIVVLSVIAFISIQVNKIIQPPKLEITEPVQAVAPAETYKEVDTDTIRIAGKVEVGSKLIINGNEVTTNNLQEFNVDQYKLNPGSNEIVIVAQSYYLSKISQIKLTVLYKTKDNNTDTTQTDSSTSQIDNSPKVESMKIRFEVTETAWVVATVDGQTKVTDNIKPGKVYSFEASERFTIYSPRSQMVKLTINDKEYTFNAQDVATFTLVGGSVIQE